MKGKGKINSKLKSKSPNSKTKKNKSPKKEVKNSKTKKNFKEMLYEGQEPYKIKKNQKNSANLSNILFNELKEYYNKIINGQNIQIENGNKNFIKCDGCYIEEAKCFCIDCNKAFCENCDSLIHIIPSNKNHIKKGIGEMPPLNKPCVVHKKSIISFCESCLEPICIDCKIIGPHNNKLHKVNNIFESYQEKKNNLTINKVKELKNKNQQILNQLYQLNDYSKKIKNIENELEKYIRNELFRLIQNLELSEGQKLAVINYERANLEKELNKIIEIIDYINETGIDDSPDMTNFLLKYKKLSNQIEESISKPINTDTDVNIKDFPREFKDQEIKIEQFDKIEKLLSFKDELIWKILSLKKCKINENNLNIQENDKEGNDNENKDSSNYKVYESNNNYDSEKMNEKSKIEIQKCTKLNDKYCKELQKYYLCCAFCGCILDKTTVNSSCPKNFSGETNDKNTEINLSPEIIGTGRHYFISSPLKENILMFKSITFDKEK